MTSVINNGIANSHFDSDLKLADLTPVDKDDDTKNKKNYRNVSLFPIVSKIFEKITTYVEDIQSHFLCGYRKGFSAQHALLFILEKWRKSLDKGVMEGESLGFIKSIRYP